MTRKASCFKRVTEVPELDRFGLGSIELIPRLLVARFGEPSPGEGHKISGQFVFANELGHAFAIYDWKMTDMYSPDMPFSPDEFWRLIEVVPMQIGGYSRDMDAFDRFLSWLGRTLHRSDRRTQ